ncbi:MAG: hypothetical protein HY556_02250 [Euryarchaeota archaeon]|nr:hypothetical protein [Euryarchaeota archaeon]
MGRDLTLTKDPEEIERIVRLLAASVNVKILSVLNEERRKGEGWLFLSEIADRTSEKPGTIGLAIQKLLPLLEERREKGRRYFRSRIKEFRIVLDEVGPKRS